MKVTLQSTDHLVTVSRDGHVVEGRVWEGQTESGIRVHALITRIAVHMRDDQAQFERELLEVHPPASYRSVQAFPRSLVL